MPARRVKVSSEDSREDLKIISRKMKEAWGKIKSPSFSEIDESLANL